MSLVVVMPAWNEAEGIADFIGELDQALSEWSPEFVVVDDASTDGTVAQLQALVDAGVRVHVTVNHVNRGHGPSTMRALALGLELGASTVVAVDGDGQFIGSDLARVVRERESTGADIVEGVRTSRSDPAYRRVVSWVTRLLVRTRAGCWPADANTPLRAYDPNALRGLLVVVPAGASTPNLIISAISRRRGLDVREISVTSIPRRGSDKGGSTWGKRRTILPSKRFLSFCGRAAREWFSVATDAELPRPATST